MIITIEKCPYSDVANWWPNLEKIREIIDAAINSVSVPTDHWPKFVDRNHPQLKAFILEGWEIKQGKEKAWLESLGRI